MAPAESHNEWYHYYCSNFYLVKMGFTVCFLNLLQALLVEPHKDYNLHWPMRRGRLNVHNGPCGTLTSVLSDLELIWGTAIQTMLDIPIKDLKVISYSEHDMIKPKQTFSSLQICK